MSPILNHRTPFSFGIAQVLRTKEETVVDFFKKMDAVTGKSKILDEIVFENNALVERTLLELGLGEEDKETRGLAEKIYRTMVDHLIIYDLGLSDVFKKPDLKNPASLEPMIKMARDLGGVKTGFFLKESKAKEMLKENPPPTIIEILGYKNINELLEKESVWEIYPALRFLESSDWMNSVFIKSYKNIKAEDFEERELKMFVLPERWLKLAEKFMAKKYHNVSHLKELGVIFIIPLSLNIDGEMLRLFSLLLHYIHEVPFYSKLLRQYAGRQDSFSENLMSLLRGDVLEGSLPDPGPGKMNVRIVQRYLAKDNPQDPRLFEPHVNPETRHWDLAENDLAKLNHLYPSLHGGFWAGLNWVGDCFLNEKGEDVMVGMNLIDTVMSLVKQRAMVKYLYHHQEAFWNQIFIKYLGIKEVDRLIEENIIKGYFTIG